jgi:hypothetical protein
MEMKSNIKIRSVVYPKTKYVVFYYQVPIAFLTSSKLHVLKKIVLLFFRSSFFKQPQVTSSWFKTKKIQNSIDALPSHRVKPTWGFHKVKLRKVELSSTLPASNSRKGVKGRVGSPGIRLGRGTSLACVILHPKTNPTRLV